MFDDKINRSFVKGANAYSFQLLENVNCQNNKPFICNKFFNYIAGYNRKAYFY